MDRIEPPGGIALFLYGMPLANDGLQKRAGDQLRRRLTTFTAPPERSPFGHAARRGAAKRHAAVMVRVPTGVEPTTASARGWRAPAPAS